MNNKSLELAVVNLFDFYSNLSEHTDSNFAQLRELICSVLVAAVKCDDGKVKDIAREALITLDCEELDLSQLHAYLTFIFEELEVG